jgi:hypothetical protein
VLEEAVVAYGAALEERTRERVPFQWAGTQNNLGNALRIIGERQSGTAGLNEAVSAFSEALKELTPKSPIDWASTFGDQGVAMSLIADRTNDGALSETAVAQIGGLRDATRRGPKDLGDDVSGATAEGTGDPRPAQGQVSDATARPCARVPPAPGDADGCRDGGGF